MKTPEEIKEAVGLCLLSECRKDCPYYEDVSCRTMLFSPASRSLKAA